MISIILLISNKKNNTFAATLPDGVTGNTPGSDSGDSWFESLSGNKKEAVLFEQPLLVYFEKMISRNVGLHNRKAAYKLDFLHPIYVLMQFY